jgi:hypothetical protein
METKHEVLRAMVTPTQRAYFLSEATRRGLTISDALRQALDLWTRSGENERLMREILSRDEVEHVNAQQ